MSNSKYTDSQFIEAVQSSTSLSDVANKLNISNRGSFKVIHRKIKKMNLSTAHFLRKKFKHSKWLEIDKEKLISLVNESLSYSELLEKLGRSCSSGSNQTKIKELVNKHNINTSHFTGMLWSKGRHLQPIMTYLIDNSDCSGPSINSHDLKLRLIKEGILNWRCSSCQLSEWLNVPIPIELDHINGNHFDNRLENLRILCPNCHSFTSTYRGRK